jgi:hypothetical protein
MNNTTAISTIVAGKQEGGKEINECYRKTRVGEYNLETIGGSPHHRS